MIALGSATKVHLLAGVTDMSVAGDLKVAENGRCGTHVWNMVFFPKFPPPGSYSFLLNLGMFGARPFWPPSDIDFQTARFHRFLRRPPQILHSHLRTAPRSKAVPCSETKKRELRG